jgi:hypothetical protein
MGGIRVGGMGMTRYWGIWHHGDNKGMGPGMTGNLLFSQWLQRGDPTDVETCSSFPAIPGQSEEPCPNGDNKGMGIKAWGGCMYTMPTPCCMGQTAFRFAPRNSARAWAAWGQRWGRLGTA